LAVLLEVLAIGLGVCRGQRATDAAVTRPARASITESIASSGRVRGVTETRAGVQAAGVVDMRSPSRTNLPLGRQRLVILKNNVADARAAQAEVARNIS
jgi:hypothetical protein